MEKHAMPDDAFFYVVKGGGIIEIGEEQTSAAETDIVFSPKNTPVTCMYALSPFSRY